MRTSTPARGQWLLVGLAVLWLGTAVEVGAMRTPVVVSDLVANPRAARPASRDMVEGVHNPPTREQKRGIRPPWREPWIPEMRRQPDRPARKLTA